MNIAARVLAGTAIYALIVLLAAPFPHVAGLMLTFPALNGLGFIFAGRPQIAGMASSMLWMPVLNGVLCASYIAIYLLAVPAAAPRLLAWSLALAVGILWIAIAFTPRVRAGIPSGGQFRYGLIATGAGMVVVVIVAIAIEPSLAVARPGGAGVSSVLETLSQASLKIGLFAACLAIFLLAARFADLSDAVRGILAGLPLVPFAGLLSVGASTEAGPAETADIFRKMLESIGLAPAVAIWFIYGFSRVLIARPPSASAAMDMGVKGLLLVMAWMLCGLAIAAIAIALWVVRL